MSLKTGNRQVDRRAGSTRGSDNAPTRVKSIRQIEREDFILGNRSIGFEEPCRHPYPEGCKRKREQVSDKKTK